MQILTASTYHKNIIFLCIITEPITRVIGLNNSNNKVKIYGIFSRVVLFIFIDEKFENTIAALSYLSPDT